MGDKNELQETEFHVIMSILKRLDKKVDNIDEKVNEMEKTYITSLEPLKIKVAFLLGGFMLLVSSIIGWYIEH